MRMKKAIEFSTVHTERLQNLQTSLVRSGVLLSMRLQRNGDETYMQNFSGKNVGKCPGE